MRQFDVILKVEKKMRADIFGWFAESYTLTPEEQKTAAEKIAADHKMKLVSHAMKSGKLVVRLQEGA